MNNIDELKKEFEAFTGKNFNIKASSCDSESCDSDEESSLKDYPSYTDALYAALASPYASGIYLSRWDIKNIAQAAGESMAIHPRKRMFELLMKFAATKEDMQNVLDALKEHMEEKIAIYEELMTHFPASAEIFAPKIQKAQKTIKLFPQILKEYFE